MPIFRYRVIGRNVTQVGVSSSMLGAGRTKRDDPIDYSAGIVLEKKTGDQVRRGDVLAWLHTNDEALLADAEARFRAALTWGDAAPAPQPLIYDIVR